MPEFRTKLSKIIQRVSLTLFFCLIFRLAFAADTTPPTGSIKINNGAASTTSINVTLNLLAQDTGSGVGQMKFSNNNSSWSSPEAYNTTKAWTLTPGKGIKTVYVKFQDKAGNWSRSYHDRIRSTAPAVILSISINPKTWDIGSLNPGSMATISPANKITVTNDGSGPETLALQLINPAGWTASNQPGTETYVLSGIFCNTTDVPSAGNFSAEDVITTLSQRATSTVFAYSAATANGSAVPNAGARSLYLQFQSPTATSKNSEQNINLIVSCQIP